MTTARDLAQEALQRILLEGAYASAVLDSLMQKSSSLSEADRALASEIVFGVLRYRPWLERKLHEASDHGLDPRLDPIVKVPMIAAAYQIAFLDRVPAYAAVSSAVGFIRGLRGARLAGFANAVLRRLSERNKPSLKPPVPTTRHSIEEIAEWTCIPSWVIDGWVQSLGKEDAVGLAVASNAPAPATLRATPKSGGRETLQEQLAAAGVQGLEPCPLSPAGLKIGSRTHAAIRNAVAQGLAVFQDEGAQFAAYSLGAEPGEKVLDACAGRGGKTAILSMAAGPSGHVVSVDHNPSKLARLAEALSHQGVARADPLLADLTQGSGLKEKSFDRALVDAPCSGDGTIRRRPDIKERLNQDISAKLCVVQETILDTAAQTLKHGGRLLYMVCSLLPEQGPEQARRFLNKHHEFVLEPLSKDPPFNYPEIFLLPHKHQTDGFYLASFRHQ